MLYFLSRISDWTGKRQAMLIASLFYAFVVYHVHVSYLSVTWDYFGFTYAPIGVSEILFIVGLVLFGALFVPILLDRPSSIILIELYIIVYIPTVVISLCLDTDRINRYGGILLALAIGFSLACILTRMNNKHVPHDAALPGDKFINNVFLLWLACAGILVASFISIMTFAGLEEIYDQRSLGKESTTLFLGYTQTYFSNVFSPAILTIGLLKSRWKQVLLGIIGCLVAFMIDAQKAVFLMPFVMIGLHNALQSKYVAFRSNVTFIFILGTVALISISFVEGSELATFISGALVYRTLMLPGVMLTQYYDYFSSEGFTYWSHVRLLNLFIPVPDGYENDPYWPRLGYIIGEKVQNMPGNNANANLFADSGAAAAGWVGILVIGIMLAAWLIAVDKASEGWDRRYVLLVLFPVGLFLTNGSIFSVLMGYGGAFWLIVLYLYKPNLSVNNEKEKTEKLADYIYTN